MKIENLNSLQMNRTDSAHYGSSKVLSMSEIAGNSAAVDFSGKVSGSMIGAGIPSAEKTGNMEQQTASFQNYLMKAMSGMNSDQLNVSKLEEQLITDPDSVDIHDVTIAMAKARSSLNLAKTVIDHLVKGWSEITTTR